MDMKDLCVLSVNWGEQDVKYEHLHYFMHTVALMRIKTQLCRNTFFLQFTQENVLAKHRHEHPVCNTIKTALSYFPVA